MLRLAFPPTPPTASPTAQSRPPHTPIRPSPSASPLQRHPGRRNPAFPHAALAVSRLPFWALPCSPPGKPSSPAAAVDGEGFDAELARLLALLPEEMRERLGAHPELRRLIEIVMDLGRRPLARFPSGDFFLSEHPITSRDLHHASSQVGDFTADNRAGISRTLHRISAIRNRKGVIVGLTCRVGRAVSGSANSLRDLVEDGASLLLIGPPGVGKTTIIREIARMLADDFKKRVVIVDTSNEIGGDGDIPHAGIGSARRMQVPNPDMQHKVLIEAVENHMPQVIVIDEIGTRLEAMAASTIAQRGIQLVATAHGVTIENLTMNPLLEMLVGGIQILEISMVQAINQLKLDEVIELTDNISEANAFLALYSKLKKNSRIQAAAKSHEVPIYVTKTSSLLQITKALRALVAENGNAFERSQPEENVSSFEKADALEEARLAIEEVVIPKGQSVELLPRPPHIISAQMDFIQRYKLKSEKTGQESNIRLCIFPIHTEISSSEMDGASHQIELDDLNDIDSYRGPVRLPLLPE